MAALAGKPKQNMVPHLCKCIYVDPTTKTRAQFARAETTAADESALCQAFRRPSLSHSVSWSHLQLPVSAWPGGPSTSATPSPLPSRLLFDTSLPAPPKRRRTLRTLGCHGPQPCSPNSACANYLLRSVHHGTLRITRSLRRIFFSRNDTGCSRPPFEAALHFFQLTEIHLPLAWITSGRPRQGN